MLSITFTIAHEISPTKRTPSPIRNKAPFPQAIAQIVNAIAAMIDTASMMVFIVPNNFSALLLRGS